MVAGRVTGLGANALAVWIFVVLIGWVGSANANTLFTEDFESYASGSNLVGQGGWIEGYTGGSVLRVNGGSCLPTQVLDGRAATGLRKENVVDHAVVFSPNPAAITTLWFDAYASSAYPITHNMSIGFDDTLGDGSSFDADWTPHAYRAGGLQWMFNSGGNVTFVLGGYDQHLRMGIVVDGAANEVYGLYDFGSGLLQTPHFSATDAEIASLEALRIYLDNRASYSTGMEVDNILVTDNQPIPEPLTMLSAFSAIGGLGGYVRRRMKRQAAG